MEPYLVWCFWNNKHNYRHLLHHLADK